MTQLIEKFELSYAAAHVDADGDTFTLSDGVSFKAARKSAWQAAKGMCDKEVGDTLPPTPRAMGFIRDVDSPRWIAEWDDQLFIITERKVRA